MKKKFLYDSKNPNKSMNIFNNNNPNDTIPIKYSSLDELKKTINKLEYYFKNDLYTHQRISQVAVILMVRTKIIKNKNPKIDKGRYKLAQKYLNFLKKRTKSKNRKSLVFNI